MRHVAGFALTTSSVFLAIVAIMLNSPSLFYMATALIATIAACHFQAWLAVKGLRFERVAPGTARIGDLITIEISVWSERKIRRPLITLLDALPPEMHINYLSPSLPIAPAYDLPIQTQYQFRARRRGKYEWSGVTVEGTDALGLVTKRRGYETPSTAITILPRPIPVSVELPAAAGWGISEAESGQTRGAGIEPRGVREYTFGDSLRHVHWRSSARAGRLLVKEFEAGTHAATAFIFQRTEGTDIGAGPTTSLDLMCGHAVFLADNFLRQGAKVELPGVENGPSWAAPSERIHEIYELLSDIQADQSNSISRDALQLSHGLPHGSVLFLLVVVADPDLPGAISQVVGRGTQVVALLYDSHAFQKGKIKRPGKPSAADALFVEEVRAAGALPVVMPIDIDETEEEAA